MITLKIVGDYNNGHHYERTVQVPGPMPGRRVPAIEEWWWDVVFNETGDGQTGRKDVGIHTCTVLAADPPDDDLVGVEYDLGG